MSIPVEAFNRAVRLANKAGLEGLRVNIFWLPPQTGAQSYQGSFAVEALPPLSGSENDDKGRA